MPVSLMMQKSHISPLPTIDEQEQLDSCSKLPPLRSRWRAQQNLTMRDPSLIPAKLERVNLALVPSRTVSAE